MFIYVMFKKVEKLNFILKFLRIMNMIILLNKGESYFLDKEGGSIKEIKLYRGRNTLLGMKLCIERFRKMKLKICKS